MASVNPLTKEILLKVVYYGPGLGGKTTTLQFIHRTAKPEHRGKMVSLATPVDRTLYFDFLPIKLPKIGNYTLRLQLFTVPGQVHYNATRKLVLTGSDGTVFVADSQVTRIDANIESLENLKDNLAEQKIDFESHPLSFQYNKRDLENVYSVKELDLELNSRGCPSIGTCAISGDGVYRGLEAITKKVLRDLKRREILIHDERSTAERIEKRITFKEESQGILSSVKEFSESSSHKVVQPTSDEKTATYPGMMPVFEPSQTIVAVTSEISVDEPEEIEPKDKETQPPAAAVKDRQTEPAAKPVGEEPKCPTAIPATVPPFTFAPMWPLSAQDRITDIERDICEGRDSEAIQAIWKELERLLAIAQRGLPDSSQESLITLLGLSGRQYLEVARLARSASPDKHISNNILLRAYLLLLQAVSLVEPID